MPAMDEINSLGRISGIVKKRPNKEQSSGIPAKRLKTSTDDTFEFLSPATLQSRKKTRMSPDDTCSVASSTISQRLAYGGRRYTDDLDSDDESVSTMTTTARRIIPIDTSTLKREDGVLFSEDITDDYEVWTMQCPDDIKIEELVGKSIDFDNVSALKLNNMFSNKVEMIPYKCKDDSKLTMVAPSEETNKLCLNIVPVTGKIIMSSRVRLDNSSSTPLPVDTIEHAEKLRSDLMARITQRLSKKNNLNNGVGAENKPLLKY